MRVAYSLEQFLSQPNEYDCINISNGKKIDFSSLQELMRVLQTSDQKVKILNLNSQGIANEGAKLVGEMLQNNSTIKNLYLSRNNIGNEGAIFIAKGLEFNNTLEELYLSGEKNAKKEKDIDNFIGDEAALPISDAIFKNNSLKKLTLSYNDFSEKGKIAIGIALSDNDTLKNITLDGSKNCKKQLVELCEQNMNLKGKSAKSVVDYEDSEEDSSEEKPTSEEKLTKKEPIEYSSYVTHEEDNEVETLGSAPDSFDNAE